MAEPRMVRGPDGELYQVPAEATDTQISAYFKAIPAANAPNAPKAKTWTDTTAALALASVKPAVSGIKTLAEEIATRPGLARTAGTIGEVAGGIKGLAGGSPLSVVGGMMAGKRAGQLLGQTAQRIAAPVARAAEAVEPYTPTSATLSGAQGVLDLAQMAEPTRKDIGFLGVGSSNPIDIKDPDTVLRIVRHTQSLGEAVSALQQLGMPQSEAVRTVWNLKAKVGDAFSWIKKEK